MEKCRKCNVAPRDKYCKGINLFMGALRIGNCYYPSDPEKANEELEKSSARTRELFEVPVGEVLCTDCLGDGGFIIEDEDGFDIERCETCKGHGTLICSGCNGSGYPGYPRSPSSSCDACRIPTGESRHVYMGLDIYRRLVQGYIHRVIDEELDAEWAMSIFRRDSRLSWFECPYGRVQCDRCSGRGGHLVLDDGDPRVDTCIHCDGKGHVHCGRCSGTGWLR